MVEEVINVRVERASIQEALSLLPNEVVGDIALLNAVGLALLGRIKRAFVVKARGGIDEAGDSWKPLSPKTIAYSVTRQRGKGGRTKAEKSRSTRPSQALNARQQSRWWTLYKQGLAMFKGDKGHAAARAWFILKKEGAVTLLDKYGHRQVEILRDTGILLNSLSPGVAPNQIFHTRKGEVIVGTNRKGAGYHHRGIPNRLPRRRLWPDPRRWPATWWADIMEVARGVVLRIVSRVIRGAS